MRDVVVVGAGIVGAACAYYLARAGARVIVLDAGPIAGGTSSAGEGNLLVSDKALGPELDLGLVSLRRWHEIGEQVGADEIELVAKGGLMVAGTGQSGDRLAELAAAQRAAGVAVTELGGDRLADYEPQLVGGLAGGAYYPQDAQVQPIRATAYLLRGLDVRCGTRVEAIETDAAGRVRGVRVGAVESGPAAVTAGYAPQAPLRPLAAGLVRADAVVNATGVAGGELAGTVGTRLPIEPRRGFILVTEPLAGAPVRHKVYQAEYLADVASADTGLQSSLVVEGTQAGTVLIGSSRERVGFDPTYPLPVLRRIAAAAVALFPFLAGVRVLRAYRGFRPYTPDHLPVIGPDPVVTGLWHACGHEGAGIGLASGTGAMIAALVTGTEPEVDPAPYAPARFAG